MTNVKLYILQQQIDSATDCFSNSTKISENIPWKLQKNCIIISKQNLNNLELSQIENEKLKGKLTGIFC